jgi:hypothetical protein
MDASLGRSIIKALRDLGVQGGSVILLVILAIANEPAAMAAVARVLPPWLVGLAPVVFLVARTVQDQIKHRPNVGQEK